MSVFFLILVYFAYFCKKIQNQNPRIPTIVFEDGSFLVEPSDIDLENKLKELNYI